MMNDDCTLCGGLGWFEDTCSECVEGEADCRVCHGEEDDCPVCFGDGWLACEACDGWGITQVTCLVCDVGDTE